MRDDKKITVKFETTRDEMMRALWSTKKCPGDTFRCAPSQLRNCEEGGRTGDDCKRCISNFIDRITVRESNLTEPTNVEKLWAHARDHFFENAFHVISGAVKDHGKTMEDLDEDLADTILKGLVGGKDGGG